MASDVGSSVAGEARRGQSRPSDASRTSSKTSSKKGMQTTENAIPNFQSRRGSERPEKLNRQDYVNMLGGDIFEAFMRKREAVMQEAANYQKMKMMTRHSARYIDAHERSLTNEFQKFLEFAETQRLNEARRAKLLGLPPQSAPANVFAARPAGNFGLRPLERLTREEWEERRASAKRYLKIQMERIQNIRVARTSIRPRLRSAPSLQAVDLSDVIRKKTMTPRRLTQFSAEFQREELPHYAMFPVQRRTATVPAEAQENLYRWMEDFFREHVPVEDADSESSKRGKRCSLKDSQLRDEQMLERLCSIASAPPSYIAESPWHVRGKASPQRGSKYDRLHSPFAKESKRVMRIDLELAAQFQARKLQRRKLSSQPRTPSLGKRKRRPQTAVTSPRKMFVEEDAAETILNSAVLVKFASRDFDHWQLQEAGVEEIDSVRYISLSSRHIGGVNSQDLKFFTSLRCLDLSGNHVPLIRVTLLAVQMSLAPLTALRKLILLGNQQSELEIPEGSFQELEVLDVSYNLLNDMAVIALSSLPSLRKLNMNNNNLELIPPEATETGAFVRLETLCVAGNSLSSTCLLSLSKLPWLEVLHLHSNHIKYIPHEIISMARAFSRLETLDLAENPINYHQNLIALEKMQKLRKVFLWDTPLSRTISYDGSGKCSLRSVPILQAAMRAQRAGQNWFLVKTDNMVIKDGCYSDKLLYFVENEPGMTRDEKIKARLEKNRRVEEEVQNAMLRNAASRIERGSTSVISQSPETNEAEMFIADSRKVSFTNKSPRRRYELESLVNEEMVKLMNVPSPAEPYLSQAQAAVSVARRALGLSPREVKDATVEQKQSSQADRSFLLGNVAWKKASGLFANDPEETKESKGKKSSTNTSSKRPSTNQRKKTSTDTSSKRPPTEQRKRSFTKPKQGA